MEKKRILIVDDDRDLVQSIEDILSTQYDVLKAYNGTEGLELAKKERPDLMILDVMMDTDTEGFDVSRAIKDDPDLKGLKIIMLTAITSEKNLPFKFEPDDTWLPVATVLEKPLAPDALLKEVETRLNE
jgi:CheY-like chemotaxis protein